MAKPRVDFEKSHVVELVYESLPWTIYGVRWIPSSCRFAVFGSTPRATGALQVYRLNTADQRPGEVLKRVLDLKGSSPIKCATMQCADPIQRELATGSTTGLLEQWDLNEDKGKPIVSRKIHGGVINSIDGGGKPGPAEIVTGSADGRAFVSDFRAEELVVSTLVPEGEKRDCWAVAMGGTTGPQDRVVAVGYDNGDVKLWDLRTSAVSWETNVRNGVASLSFAERWAPPRRLVCGCLQGQIVAFDLTERPADRSYPSHTERVKDAATVWFCETCPQKRNVFASPGMGGEVIVWTAEAKGCKFSKLTTIQLSTQPIVGFDWHQQKEGLCVMGAFDQTMRVGYVTHLSAKK